MNISAAVNTLESELSRIRNENDSMAMTITLQSEQLQNLLEEQNKLRRERTLLIEMQNIELDRTRYERDVAITRATKVVSLIEAIGKMALEGVLTMREDIKLRETATAQIEADTNPNLPRVEFAS